MVVVANSDVDMDAGKEFETAVKTDIWICGLLKVMEPGMIELVTLLLVKVVMEAGACTEVVIREGVVAEILGANGLAKDNFALEEFRGSRPRDDDVVLKRGLGDGFEVRFMLLDEDTAIPLELLGLGGVVVLMFCASVELATVDRRVAYGVELATVDRVAYGVVETEEVETAIVED
jgi:hypothetical protein